MSCSKRDLRKMFQRARKRFIRARTPELRVRYEAVAKRCSEADPKNAAPALQLWIDGFDPPPRTVDLSGEHVFGSGLYIDGTRR